MAQLIGESIGRVDGPAKVSGRALYVDDLHVPGCYYGATVRSIHAHALIRGITLNLDYDWSDVVVVTSVDIPGENVIALMTDDQPALAEQVVRHVTEPIALVAAPTREKALEAARNVRGEYQPLTALTAGTCELMIQDEGPGIPAENQSKVFQLYFTTKEKGSGIGLAMTFRAVQLHNGTIEFTSEVGKGTVFRLRFPVSTEAA